MNWSASFIIKIGLEHKGHVKEILYFIHDILTLLVLVHHGSVGIAHAYSHPYNLPERVIMKKRETDNRFLARMV
ncbi:hypothetical protein HLI_13190 [Halobacillus litoralis]|uniref:Uncharacterized protein n=1 Tax=Halobacillus litoralis TaxID=45668 RepID=A0A410MED2_9BACI|nr:hypothetical protein HLI_13190 [Halobacillus litoralis]